MTGLWSALILLIQVTNTGRRPWVKPVPGVRIEPTRPVRQVEDFGPDSAYRLLMRADALAGAKNLPDAWYRYTKRLANHPWATHPPGPLGTDQAWSRQDRAAARTLLAKLEPGLELARQATVATDVRFPTFTASAGKTSGQLSGLYTSSIRRAARRFVFSACGKEGEGDLAGAMAELLTSIRCGDIGTRGGILLNHMIAMEDSQVAANAMWRIATRNVVPSPALRRTAQELLRIADQVEPLAEAFRHDAQMGWVPDEYAGPSHDLLLGWEPESPTMRWAVWLAIGSPQRVVERNVGCFFQNLIHLSGKPYHRVTDDKVTAFADQQGVDTTMRLWSPNGESGLGLIRLRVILSTEDPAGWALTRGSGAVYCQAITKAAERDAEWRGTALYLAIRAYDADHGKPPVKLNALIPKYLPRVPLDPFDGKPLRYVAGKTPKAWNGAPWGIYSIGRDFNDDGGLLADPGKVGKGTVRFGKSRRPKSASDIVWIPKIPPTP